MQVNNAVIKELEGHQIVYSQMEPMKKHTSFKIGGPAEIFITPDSEEQLLKTINICRKYEIERHIIGNGSNLLVSDGGIKGAVIALKNLFGNITLEGSDKNVISAQAGAALSQLCKFAQANCLSGLEFSWGIPGSVGGAIYMNAGAYGGEIKDVISSIRVLDNEIFTELDASQAGFGYRKSAFQDSEYIITAGKFKLEFDEEKNITDRMKEIAEKRTSKQPLDYPSAGSAFKRPNGNYAAALIEQCGLKGLKIGGAQVSEKHSGFIINAENATCADVCKLLDKVREIVYKETGIELEEEVKRI